MTKSKIFSDIINQEFTANFLDGDISTGTVNKFSRQLSRYLLNEQRLGILSASRVKGDFFIWLYEQDVIEELEKYFSQEDAKSMRIAASKADQVYNKPVKVRL